MNFSKKYIVSILIVSLTTTILAQDFVVPSSWEKIAEAQDGGILSISIQDGWIAWMEKRLDESSAMHRAQSFFVGLYRKRIGSEDIEVLMKPSSSRPSGDQFVLGQGGVVSYNYRARYHQSLYPGKLNDPIILNGQGDAFFRGEDTPVRIYDDAMLCVNHEGIKQGLCLIPFDEGKPELSGKQVIFEPKDVEIQDACLSGNYVLYSTERSIGLYDTESKKPRATFELRKRTAKNRFIETKFSDVYLKGGYAYFYLSYNCSDLWVSELYRFSIKSQMLERVTLPRGLCHLIDFKPEKVIGVYRTDNKAYEILEFDLLTGEIYKYDFPITKNTHWKEGCRIAESRFFQVATHDRKGSYSGKTRGAVERFYYCGDVGYDKLLVTYKSTVYLVPKANGSPESWASLGWTPTIRSEIKDVLIIKISDRK